MVKVPHEYQYKYEKHYQSKIRVKFSQRVSRNTFLKFRLLSAYFSTNNDALDYLISSEIKKEKNFSLSDCDYS